MTTFQPVPVTDLADLITLLFERAGVVAEEARIVAEHLVDAEARENRAQGLVRLKPYIQWVRSGKIAPRTELRIEHEHGATLMVDAGNGWGQVAAIRTIELCVERARTHGVCLAVVRNTNHIGRLGAYVEGAAAAGMVGLVACSGNPQSAWVAPWGGTQPLFGTNPLALGFPRHDGPPIVVDISTTQVARGSVLMAQKLGHPIPLGWAFDAQGEPTEDPHQALPPHGTLAPLGGHKGYGLALAIEILCGVLAGMWPPANSANLIGAIDVSAFIPLEQYNASLDGLLAAVKANPVRPGTDVILIPGQGSAHRRQDSLAHGLTIAPELWSEVTELAMQLRVHHPLLT